MIPIMTDKMYEDLFQIGTTPEMLGVKDMSAEQVVLIDNPVKMTVMKSNLKDCVFIKIVNMEENKPVAAMIIDRNQAHLLKLWLEEHLK